MTVQIVPTDSLPSYQETVTLEGTKYVLQFDYSERCASWYMSIADASGVDIYNGVKLVVGLPLLRRCKDPRRPPGALVVISSTADNTPPSLFDLVPNAGRCVLYYITSDIVTQLVNGQVNAVIAQIDAGAAASSLSTYGQE